MMPKHKTSRTTMPQPIASRCCCGGGISGRGVAIAAATLSLPQAFLHASGAAALGAGHRLSAGTWRSSSIPLRAAHHPRSISSWSRRCYSHVPSLSSIYPLYPPFQLNLPQRSTKSRLFGTKRGIPSNPPGDISIDNEQTALDDLDLDRIEQTLSSLRDLCGYSTYDVSLLLVDDDEMRQTNLETRGVDGPTDILSFPMQEVAEKGRPGILLEPEFDIPDYYSLGDMMLDVAYVMRRCEEDRRDNGGAADGSDDDNDSAEDRVVAAAAEQDAASDNVDDERGVSGAMASVYDPEERIHMLLVHGMLHLVGYDHIDDEDYEQMVTKEEEFLEELRTRGQIK